MNYIFFRVMQRVWYSRRVYAVILIEITLGLTMLQVGSNAAISAQRKTLEFKDQMAGNYLSVHAYSDRGYENAHLTLADYEAIKRVSPGEVQYMSQAFDAMMNGSEGIMNIMVLYISENWAEQLFGIHLTEDEVYIGKRIREVVSRVNTVSFENLVQIQDGKVSVGTKIKNKEPRTLSESRRVFFHTTEGSSVLLDDCIVVSCRNMELKTEISASLIRIQNTVDLTYILRHEMMQDLSESHKEEGTTYGITNENKALEIQIKDLRMSTDMMIWLALFFFIIVTFGLAGIFILFLYRRREEIAISCALGATFHVLCIELFMEIFFLFLSGTLLSLFASLAGNSLFHTAVFTVSPQLPSFILVFLLAIFESLVLTLAVAGGIYHLKPSEILRRER